MEICKIENLTFTYPEQEHPVLQSIDLSIGQGEFVVLFGESGSGKTTLLKMLKRELMPHGNVTGEVFYHGKNIQQLDERTAASDIGFIMQNPETQIVTDKVWHELAFGLENLGVPTQVIRRRVGEIANYFGIHTWFREKTTDLSGGQKQLLNVASIMVMQPEILVLDEPTSQLDPIAASNFIDTLENLNRDLGLTIVMVEHRLEEVLPLADKVVLLEAGKIICTDQPRNIGNRLIEMDEKHRMLPALPTPMKVFHGVYKVGESPLTVREGKAFLSEYINGVIPAYQPKQLKKAHSDPILSLKNIWFRYERDLPDILESVDLDIHQGELISILGGNGSGKTTLLNVIAGQHRAYRGNVILNGKKIQKYKRKELYQHHLAVLPQDPLTVFLKNTVRTDYEEIAKVFNYSSAEIDQHIAKIAAELQITHLLDKHPYDLSGGEQQKVALGKILLLQPKILLLDEPTKGMDAFSKQSLHILLKNLQAQGMTIIIITHDVEFAAMISDCVGLFFDRHLISMDTPTNFFSENNYYTTVASRMSRHISDHLITYEDILTICKMSQEKVYEKTVD